MPKVSLLYIDDSIVAPHLQLLRQVCEPTSSSRPHVTVRFFERLEVPDEYRSTKVSHIDLVEPGMFKSKSDSLSLARGVREPNPVFIRCKSDDLAPLEHKPHFPGSDFHITIYDGPSNVFAVHVLQLLEKYAWQLRVPLRRPTALVIKELKTTKSRHVGVNQDYSPELKQLFFDITRRELSKHELLGLREDGRLKLCKKILTHLFLATRAFKRLNVSKTRLTEQTKGPVETSRLHDVHLTPPELAREIAAYAVSVITSAQVKIHFGDPAVGTGAFFAALLHVVKKSRVASAIGVDINPEQAAAAMWRWGHRGMKVLNEDYLHLERLPHRSLILANPPYLRHQHIPSDYKTLLRQTASIRTNIPISARSGLYVYFLLLAHAWMDPGAVAAWLIPSEFMRSVYGSAVRRYLTDKVELLRVHVYGSSIPLFENADVAPSVVVFRNQEPKPGHKVEMTSGGGLETPQTQDEVSLYELRRAATWSVPFAVRRETQRECRIGDLFIVKRGIATGANAFFILARQEAKELGIPEIALKPVLPKAKTLITDVIEAEPDGYPAIAPQLCVIDCDLPLEQLATRYPAFMNYLESAIGGGLVNGRLLRDRRIWYKQETREPPPFLCTYMGRGSEDRAPLRFIRNKSRAIATNTYLLMYPRAPLAEMIVQEPKIADLLFTALREIAFAEISEHARVYAGGMLKIEPKELASVCIKLPRELANAAPQDQLSLFPSDESPM